MTIAYNSKATGSVVAKFYVESPGAEGTKIKLANTCNRKNIKSQMHSKLYNSSQRYVFLIAED